MRIAIVAPAAVPFVRGGAENLWEGWLAAFNEHADCNAELISVPSPEQDFWSIVDSYARFASLDLERFDRVISTKYPAWMVAHGDHHVYLQHKLRGLYDCWPETLPTAVPGHDRDALRPLLRVVATSRGARSALPDIFGELQRLRARADDLPPALFSLPGALLRRVVHALDDIGLARQAIRRYAAISATVVQREDYFPANVDRAREVRVLHHPTLPRSPAASPVLPAGAIFSASRLDGPKRMDWLIAAHARSHVDAPLLIAGEGPQRPALEQAANASPGDVRLLGRLGESELARAYEDALFVAYTPDREDYGLITLEALQAGKPVLSCSDAGGVTELVRDGENGLITAPTVPALADGMRRLVEDDALRERLAARAVASVAHIRWDTLVNAFAGRAARVAVINTFSLLPARSGGQLRMWHLYSELARAMDVRCVNLVPLGSAAGAFQRAPGLTEVLVPMTAEHASSQQALDRRLDASCFDLAALLEPGLTPAWVAAVRDAAAWADVVCLSHPYGWAALQAAGGAAVTVYEAHNVEADLKASIIGAGASELEEVRRLEGECARAATAILCCSKADGARLVELYDPPARPALVPNGVDAHSYPTLGDSERAAARARVGLDDGQGVALFVGSLHGPNLDAARHIVTLAAERRDWLFCLVGSVCDSAELAADRDAGRLPANLLLVGRVGSAELRTWLALADVGLNPVDSGSGTNLKLLEYAASGLPILSTAFGARGGLLHDEEHFRCAPLEEFAVALDELHPARRDGSVRARARAARARAQNEGDWRRSADAMRNVLEALLCA